MLSRSHDLIVYKCNQQAENGAEGVEHAVGNVDAQVESVNENCSQDEDRNYVYYETVATPRCDHIKVAEGTCCAPHDASSIASFYPQIEGVHKSKYCHGFVIIRASRPTSNNRWHYRNKER